MTTYELIFVSASAGILIGMFVMWWDRRRVIKDLEFEKEMVLDFNEKLIRDRDTLEFRYEHEARSYIRHLDSHTCVFVPEEDLILEAEFVE